jgi:pimeloyl-ACP methyl ester carboxylesterase
MTTLVLRIIAAFTLSILLPIGSVLAQIPVPPPVAVIGDERLPIGDGVLPVFVSADWTKPAPAIRRAIIVVHGYERNAADYARNMMALGPPDDTLVVVPQFLAPEDAAAHHLPDNVLRWRRDLWSGGYPAVGPISLSSFSALDAILGKLGDGILSNLTTIVVAGFSAGGQVVQRYAIVGANETGVAGNTIRVRYVVGSPSSYAYFGDERPLANGTFADFADTAACPQFNHWKYGFAGDLPPYVATVVTNGIPALEGRYARRDVAYLVGSNDNDPNHRFLDKSCAGEAQGLNRLTRMKFFLADMRRRDSDVLRHHMWIIDASAHNEARVFGSACGRAALFGNGICSEAEVQ